MITIQTDCTLSLPCGANDIKDFTVTRCDFIFLDCSGCKIIKQSQTTQETETILLEQKYLCICYDWEENCYWAIAHGGAQVIHQLDMCFHQIGQLAMNGVYQQRAVSICCDERGKGIWVCYPCQVAFVDKSREETHWYKNEDNLRMNLGALMECGCRVKAYQEGCRQMVEIQQLCESELIEVCISKAYKIVGIAACSCEVKRLCQFYVLLFNPCSHECMLMKYWVDFSHGTEPCPPKPCPPKPCPPKPCPPKPCPPKPCPPKPCPPKPCPPKPCPPKPCPPDPHCGGSYEIMHSIALEEAGISHILNAEGEKIQKAVAISNNIDDLICVNESVKRTLTQVTLLEGMLYSKLEALVGCDCSCHDDEESCFLHFDCKNDSHEMTLHDMTCN